jgi:Transposase domain (DUF772)
MDIKFSSNWLQLQSGMFPMFEEALGEATDSHFRVMTTLDLLREEDWIESYGGPKVGKPKVERERFLRAFVAKTLLSVSTTSGLIDRLKVDDILRRICGWVFNKKLPCEASFSNAMAESSEERILEKIHESIVKRELKDDLVFNVFRYSTAVERREAVARSSLRNKKQPCLEEDLKKAKLWSCKIHKH